MSPADEARPVPKPEIEEPEEVRLEREAQKIEEVSPEGRPAVPEIKAGGIGLMLIAIVVLLVVIGIIVAIVYRPAAGIGIAAFGLVILLFNPVVWASIFRASEREEVDQHGH